MSNTIQYLSYLKFKPLTNLNNNLHVESLDVSGDSLLKGNVGIGKNSTSYPLDVSGNANVSGNAFILNTLDVSGDSLLKGNVGIGKNSASHPLDVSGNANVSGNAFILNTLDVCGNANVSGNAFILNTLDVCGNANINEADINVLDVGRIKKTQVISKIYTETDSWIALSVGDENTDNGIYPASPPEAAPLAQPPSVGDKIVMGNLGTHNAGQSVKSYATIGAHSHQLNQWRDLYINPSPNVSAITYNLQLINDVSGNKSQISINDDGFLLQVGNTAYPFHSAFTASANCQYHFWGIDTPNATPPITPLLELILGGYKHQIAMGSAAVGTDYNNLIIDARGNNNQFGSITFKVGTGLGYASEPDTLKIMDMNNDGSITMYKREGNVASAATAFNNKGWLGIGTTTPEFPLHVYGLPPGTLGDGQTYAVATPKPEGLYPIYFFAHIFAPQGVEVESTPFLISMSVQYGIFANAFVAQSDKRIKENIIDIEDTNALNKLRLLQPKTHDYVDKLTRGNTNVIGFIAQEVKEVLPRAVSLVKEYVPNFMTRCKISLTDVSNVAIVETEKDLSWNSLHDLSGNPYVDASGYASSDAFGNKHFKIKLYDPSNHEFELNTLNIIDKTHFSIDLTGSKLIDENGNFIGNSGSYLDENGNTIEYENGYFLHGQQVDDFHSLDKQAIFTVATAALQEVDRQQQADKLRISSLENEVSLLKEVNATLIERLTKLEEQMNV